MRRQIRGYFAVIVIVAIGVLVTILGQRGGMHTLTVEQQQAVDSLYRIHSRRIVEGDESQSRARIVKMLSINLNEASKQELMAVYGIGDVFSSRILEYRDALGGYYGVEQLREVRGISEEVYEKIFRNFFVPDNSYNKIYVNFATPSELCSHPYITQSMARRIDKARQRGGYFTSTEQLTEQDILLPSEAQRVARYLYFGEKNKSKE